MILYLAAIVAPAMAQDTVDLGVLQEREIRVVQKMKFQKEDKVEVGLGLGVMPFDGYTTAPQLSLRGAFHLSENLAAEVNLGGGYGFKTDRYTELEGPSYGVAVEAYRYLAHAEIDLQYTPIYAKLNLFGKTVFHHDVYALIGVGAHVKQSVLPSADIAIAPGGPIGIGTRIFLSKAMLMRVELRDSLLYEFHAQSGTGQLTNNVTVSAGLSLMLGETK
jgi:outer membrane beta-barrel protein